MSKYGGNNRIDFGVHFNTDKSSLEQVKKALQEIQNIKPTSFKGSERELREIQSLAKQVQIALQNAFNVKLNAINVDQFKSSLQDMGHNLDSLYTKLSSLGGQGKAAFNQIATSLTTTNTQLRESQGLLHSMGQTMMNTVKWGIASSVMNGFTQSVSQAFQYVKSLDSALTDIRIVTGDSTEKMSQFADQANRAAQQLGRSTMDYSKAALTFYQQGLSDENVAARTQATLKAQNITGAGQEMADYLTAVWNGYKVANEEAELYVDKLAAVADSSASNMSQLAVAMSKVASTANMLGVPVDSLNAQIATIEATTRQAPETVGNALKTIYARINDIKTGSDDAEVSLGNYTKQMAQLGVNVLDASGNLRDTGDVIEEIGGKWQTLSREQQIYLARTMAGQRQYNNLLALFENWGKYTDLLNVSMDSQGTTMQKNSRYMDSLAAHMEQLGAAGERVKSAMIDSDSFKGLIDIGTSLTNVFANFIEAIGGGGTALLALGSIVTNVFSGIISREIGNAIIQARENKAVYQEMLDKMVLVEQQKQSLAYKDPNNTAYREYIDNLGIIHQSWQVLSQDERTIQQERVKEIESLTEQKQQLQDNINLAEQFANAFKKSGYSTVSSKHLSDGIEEISIKLQDARAGLEIFDQAIQNQDFNITNLTSFREEIEKIIEKIGNTPASNNLIEVLNQIEKEGIEDVEVLNELHNKWDSFEQQINKTMSIAPNLDKARQDLDDYDNKIKTTSTDFKRLNDNAVTLNKTESFTKLTSGVAGVASGLMAGVNAVKALKNESLPLGERILQFTSGILFSLGMTVNSAKRIKDAAVGILGPLTAQVVQEKLITKEKQRQAILDKIKATGISTRADAQTLNALDTEINRLQKGGLSTLKQSFQGIGKAAGSAFTSIIGFLTSTAGVITVVTAAAAAMGYAFYRAYTEAERTAKQAAKEASNAKQQYSKVKEQLQNLKSGFDNLHSVQDNLANLTKGSLEWKQALEEVNGQVLQLCQQFPKLNQYLYTTEDGILAFKEGAEEDLFEFQHRQTQIAGNTYVAQQTKATQAQNQADIVEASRKWGLGSLNTSNLEDLIEVMQKSGTQILDVSKENTKALKDLGFSSSDVARVQGQLKDKIISLNAEISSSATALNNLQESVTRSNLEGIAEYQNSQNKDAFVKIAAAQQTNATLDDKYYKKHGVSGKIDEDRVDKDALIQRYAEISGIEEEDLRIRRKTLQVRQENGEWEKTLSLQNLKQTIAQADIADDASKNYQEIANKMSKTATLFNQDESVMAGAYELLANQKDLEKYDFSNLDYSQFSAKATEEIENNIQQFSKLTGLSKGAISQALNDINKDLQKNFNDFVNKLSPTIQTAFKNLGVNSKDYSLDAAKALESLLMTGLQAGGDTGVEFMSNFIKDLDSSKLPDFETFIDTLNPTALSIDSLKDSFEEAGFNINATDEQLALFIDYLNQTKEAAQTPQEAYKTIHQIGDGLKRGDQIEGEDKEKLEAAGVNTDAFFEETLKGTYELKVSAKEWENYVNNISLQPAKAKIKEFQDQINGLSTFNDTSKYAYQEGQNNEATWKEFIGEGAAGGNGQTKGREQNALLGQQLSFIKGLNDLTAEQETLVTKVTDAYEKHGTVTKEQGQRIKQILIAHKGVWQDIPGAVKDAEESIDEYNEKIDATQDALDEDVDVEQWEDLAREISKIASQDKDNDIKGRFEISNEIENDRQACEELAEAMLRYDHALEQVAENYDEWKRALKSGAIQDQVQAASELRNVYGDLLDISNQDFSSEFLQSTDNLRLLQQAAKGSEEAYNQLHDAAIEDIIMHADIDTDQFHGKAQDLVNEWNAVQASVQDLEIGAHIEDSKIYSQLNDILNATATSKTQAERMLSDMGFTGQIEQATVPEHQLDSWTDAIPTVTHTTIPTAGFLPVLDAIGLGDLVPAEVQIPEVHYKSDTVEQARKNQKTFTTFRVKSGSLKKGVGGGFKFKNSTYGGGGKKTGSGGKKGGGKGSASKPSIAKKNTTKIDTKKKTQKNDPYYKNTKSLETQDRLLKSLQNTQKSLSGKERLKNLEKQNKALQAQNKLYKQRDDISKNPAYENSTADLRNRLEKEFGNNISFNTDGTIADLNKVEKAAIDAYNTTADKAKDKFEQVQDDYNHWILHTWNKHNKDWQQKNQSKKDKWDERIKKAEEAAKKEISDAEELYKTRTDLIKDYEKALADDIKNFENYVQSIRKIIENNFEASKIKVDLALDTGQLERDWMEFEDKFIKKLEDEDLVGQAASKFRKLNSYINSEEIAKASEEIQRLTKDLNDLREGRWSETLGEFITQEDKDRIAALDGQYGTEEAESLRVELTNKLEERLKELIKTNQDALVEMKDITDEIKESYLDMIDQAKDQMDEHIDQYERVNDLIQHNVKLTEMLYGDKGYATLDKYYELQKDNNYSTLQSLKEQQQYWRNQMNNEVVGSDAWKKFRENLNDAIDQVNSKMQDMLDNLAKQFENKLNAAIDRINNKLTDNLGTNYLDEQWDYLNNYDDYFLDTYNATTGVEDVTRAYQQAIDDAATNPKQQQRLNKLMNDQLKILQEKDKLTEYDLERAKSMLEVEKARMALEDARNNKTKMRLRRDSQGNYTYQYVADEEKLGDLQDALAKAQNDLYNTDKEHYKQNLNTLYDTYKEYIDKMRDLTTEYYATEDAEERQRIQNRIDLLNESYSKMYEGLTEDNKYNIQYLTQSYGDGMHIDMGALTTEEQWQVLKENVPWAQSNIQNLADSIVGEGGLLPATKSLIEELSQAVKQYDEDVQSILVSGGTSLENIANVTDEQGKALDVNITDAQQMIEYTEELVDATQQGIEELQMLLSTLDDFWNNLASNMQGYIDIMANGYNFLQKYTNNYDENDYAPQATNNTIVQTPASSTIGAQSNLTFTGDLAQDTQMLEDQFKYAIEAYREFLASMAVNSFGSGGYTGIWGDEGKLALLHQKELVLNPTDTENILAAVTAIRDATSNMNIQSQLTNLGNSTSNLLKNLIENGTLLDQNVHIDANFPNVTQHTQIEEAFNNLVNMAAMRASEYRK